MGAVRTLLRESGKGYFPLNLYPNVVEALIGNEKQKPLVLSSVDTQIFLKKAHRIYWDREANKRGELWGVAYQPTWDYDYLSLYVDYFTNLRIGDLTNGSLMEFLNMDFYLANDLVNRAVAKAQKEMEEEKRRKEIEEQERRNRKPAFKHRIKR